MSFYGSLAGVASYAKMYTDNGEFTDADCMNCLQDLETNPTKSEVLDWLEQISANMDTALAGEGFVTPVVDTQAVLTITPIINQYVADLVKYANNTGRFATDRARESGIEPMITIDKNIIVWANTHAAGLEAQGAARQSVPGNQILTKTSTAIFSRSDYGNSFARDSDADN